MTDDLDDQTPLPTAVRDSTLDMSADLPAIPLAITEVTENADAPPANLDAPEDLSEDELPHHVQPMAPFLVWGTIALIVGGVVAIGTLIGSGLALPIVAPGFAVMLVGLGSMVYGALHYPWRDDDADVFLDGGALLREHGALPALAVLTLVMMYIYANCFRGELVGDDLSFHMAEARRIADCLSVGDLDLWNPSANGGFASAYYYQVIPHLASALPAAVFGHFVFFFQLSVFLPLVLEPAAAYRGMRLLGATPWQALIAACVIGFMNGESRWGHGNAGTFQVGLYTQTWALAVFPLALGHAVRWITSGTGLASATAWSGLVFLCHPFVGIGLGFTLAIGVLWKLVGRGVDALLRIVSHGSRTEPMDTDGPIDRMFTAAARRWQHPTPRGPIGPELWRISLLGVTFAIATIPLVAPFVVDKAGFGGFPHRVPDEV
ncbi:MAG: hypothetical protein NT062_24250, partial [Proteobacteria bacterium]|nr:hypothetical protein [Pseudomonadota bacterium]